MLPQKRARLRGAPPYLDIRTDAGEEKRITDKGTSRILGINLQANMTWTAHLETGDKALLPGIRRQLGALRQLGNKLPLRCRKQLAEGLILSRFLYLIPVWGATTDSSIRRAQRLLNQVARWASGKSKRTRVRKLMESLGWLRH